jgi:hypothetical protein
MEQKQLAGKTGETAGSIERLVGLLTQVAAPTKVQQMSARRKLSAAEVGSRNLS